MMERMSLDFEGRVAVLKFNHPEVMNAVGSQMLTDFNEALGMITDPANGARCVLLTGEGRGFCAGANLQDDAPRDSSARNSGSALRNRYHPILFELRGLEMPIVTAVNGAAAGVGMSFALMGDIVCASKAAYFLQAFAKDRSRPGRGFHIHAAATGRVGACCRTFYARRASTRGDCTGMGAHQPLV